MPYFCPREMIRSGSPTAAQSGFAGEDRRAADEKIGEPGAGPTAGQGAGQRQRRGHDEKVGPAEVLLEILPGEDPDAVDTQKRKWLLDFGFAGRF